MQVLSAVGVLHDAPLESQLYRCPRDGNVEDVRAKEHGEHNLCKPSAAKVALQGKALHTRGKVCEQQVGLGRSETHTQAKLRHKPCTAAMPC